MAKSEKRQSFREMFTERFIKALEEEPMSWTRGWSFTETGMPVNVSTNTSYTGVNVVWLKFVENDNGYGDNRWATFKQIQDKGWKLNKGSKGTKVEYWIPIDRKENKSLTWAEYSKRNEGEVFKNEKGQLMDRYIVLPKTFTVFNASQIQEIPELDIKKVYNDISISEVANKISAGMGVEVTEHDNSNKAFYIPSEDKIHLPNHNQFSSDYDYSATILHELAHATGHKSRLDRKQTGKLGSQKYAYEELVAEITSSFMGEYVETLITESNMNNHVAYVKYWISMIRKQKDYLFKAIKDAEKASSFMVEKGDLEDYKTIKQEIDDKNQYTLLGRLKSDCDYYLGWGNRNVEHLYYHNEKKHIESMKEIYENLTVKPKWLTEDRIEEYEHRFCDEQATDSKEIDMNATKEADDDIEDEMEL